MAKPSYVCKCKNKGIKPPCLLGACPNKHGGFINIYIFFIAWLTPTLHGFFISEKSESA